MKNLNKFFGGAWRLRLHSGCASAEQWTCGFCAVSVSYPQI